MPEQLVLDQVVRQRTAIDRNKWLIATPSQVMNGARSNFFAGAGLAFDEYGSLVGSHLCDETLDLEKCFRTTDHGSHGRYATLRVAAFDATCRVPSIPRPNNPHCTAQLQPVGTTYAGAAL